ncbi:transmembrane protein 53-like [Tachypleus tridentatus]|uniref:transmembrane protein 53-like n=1 Tax=Tachypleus tridentatus TaxID=6853 RepID=UPI003FD39C83
MKLIQIYRQASTFFNTCKSEGRKWSQKFNSIGSNPQMRKMLLPCFIFHNMAQVHTDTVSKHIKITRNDHSDESNPPLVVLIAWMLARDHHIEKYSNIYLERGFDILTVKISPFNLLFPVYGCHVDVQSLLDFLEEQEQYQKIVVHGFSVGAYIFGEFLRKLKEKRDYLSLVRRFKGQIFDSAVDYEGILKGFPRAITNNPLLVKLVEFYTLSHLSIFYNVATKHYLESSRAFHNTLLRCPSLMLVSKDDLVGNPEANEKVMNSWKSLGLDVSWKCWDKSGHVSHLYHHKNQYIDEVDKFLKKIQL